MMLDTNKIYTVKLENGMVLSSLGGNGSYFIHKGSLPVDIFDENLYTVEVECEGNIEIYTNMQVIDRIDNPEETWFALDPIPEPNMFLEGMRSDIDYLAMMSNVDLEEV